MTVARTLSVARIFFAVAALAQQSNPYDGTWRVEFDKHIKGAHWLQERCRNANALGVLPPLLLLIWRSRF